MIRNYIWTHFNILIDFVKVKRKIKRQFDGNHPSQMLYMPAFCLGGPDHGSLGLVKYF